MFHNVYGTLMEELIIKNKRKYLRDNYPFGKTPKLTDSKHCLHCGNVFTVGDYKVFKDKKGYAFICCPNAPDCDGTVIDWFHPD